MRSKASISVLSLPLIVCLIVGAGINVVASWWIAALAPPPRVSCERMPDVWPGWLPTGKARREPTAIRSSVWQRQIDLYSYFPGTGQAGQPALLCATTVDVGFPMWSIRYERWTMPVYSTNSRTIGERRGPEDDVLRGGLDYGHAHRRLGLLPVWPGFAVNSAVYAVVAALFWFGFRRVWAGVRRRRGECGACGYSKEGLMIEAACPECGRR